MKLLEGREDFQEDSSRGEKTITCPGRRFSNKPKEICEVWGKSYEKEIYDVLDSPELVKQEIAIKDKIRNGETSRRVGAKQRNLLYHKSHQTIYLIARVSL